MTRNDKSNICKIANSLHTKGYILSQIFRIAWKLFKCKATLKAVTGGFYNGMLKGLCLNLSI